MLSTLDPRAASIPEKPVDQRRGRLLLIALLVLGWAVQVAWRIWLSRYTTLPIAHADEDSYLNTARVIAGGPAGFTNENGLLRRTGYPLLISPAFLVTQDFLVTYRVVQIINACLNAAALPLAYLLCRRALGLSRTHSYATAFAAAALPAVAWYAGVAMTDAVLAPLVLLWLVALHQWLTTPSRAGWAVAAGAAVGAIYSVHIRGLVILAIHLLVVAVWLTRRRLPWRPLLGNLTALALLAAANHVVTLYIGDKMRLLGKPPGEQTLAALMSRGGLTQFSYTVTSQLWYLLLATLGVGGVAWFAAVRQIRRPGGSDPLRWTLIAALLTTFGVAVGAAFILAGVPVRSSGVMYARYIHMVVPIWFLVGVAALIREPRRVVVRYAAYTAVLLLVAGALIALRLRLVATAGRPMGFGIFGAPEMMVFTWNFERARPLVATAVAIAGCALLVALSWWPRSRVPAVVAFLVLNALSMHALTERGVRPLVQEVVPTPTLASLGVDRGDRVVAVPGFNWRVRLGLIHQVTWADVPLVRTPPPDADVVLAPSWPGSPQDWDGTAHGFRRSGGNEQQHWVVWLRE